MPPRRELPAAHPSPRGNRAPDPHQIHPHRPIPGGLGAPKRQRRGGGFTLVEVVVSLAILALAGVALATGFASFLHSYDLASRRDTRAADVALVRAALLAEAQLETVEAWNDLTLPGDTRARWRGAVTPTQLADLFQVACEIELTSPGEPGTYTTTIHLTLLRPTWSQPDERETLRAASRDRLAERKFE